MFEASGLAHSRYSRARSTYLATTRSALGSASAKMGRTGGLGRATLATRTSLVDYHFSFQVSGLTGLLRLHILHSSLTELHFGGQC
jgi:hypothetical protein